MNITFNKNRFYVIALLIICLVLVSKLFSKCESEKVQLANIETLNSTVKNYKLKNGKLVTSVENLFYTNRQLKNSILMKDKKVKEMTNNFSKVKSITKYVTKTKFDTIKIAYKDSIPFNFEINDSLSKEWYSIAYISNQKGIEITKLKIPDSIIIVTGDKRKWFWGRRTSTTDITHENPFIETQSIQHIEVKENNKWYDSTVFKIGVGFLGGFLLTK